MSVWAKTEIVETVIHDLYNVPLHHLERRMQSYIKNAAYAAGSRKVDQCYMLTFEGENYFSMFGEHNPWSCVPCYLDPEVELTFKELVTHRDALKYERHIIDNYLTQFLNHCESSADVWHLMPKAIHPYLPLPENTNQTDKPNAMALKCQITRPGYDSLINERLLTNLLIKNM